MVQKIDSADRGLIISQFKPAVERGESKEVLDNIRKRLREKFCPDPYSEEQVNAVCSQVIIQRNRALKLLSGSDNDQKNIGMDTQAEKVNTASGIISVQLNDPEDEDYDNPIKKAWRREWKQYLLEQTNPDERKNMKVLCLPGKNCHEIPLYRDMGFLMENVTGAIKTDDKNSQDVFLKNAERYKFKAITGDLAEFLPLDTTRYDVVSLDFRAQLHANVVDVLESVRLASRAVVLMNTQAKREQSIFGDTLKYLYKRALEDKAWNEKAPSEAINISLNNTIDGHALADARDGISVLTMAIGAERHEDWISGYLKDFIEAAKKTSLYESKLRQMHEKGIFRWDQKVGLAIEAGSVWIPFVADSLQELVGQVRMDFSNFQMPKNNVANCVTDLAIHAPRGLHYTWDIKKLKYINEKGSPFHTDMAVLEAPRNIYEQIRATSDFWMKFLIRTSQDESLPSDKKGPTHHFLRFVTKSRMPVGLGASLGRSHLLECTVHDKYVAEISVGRLFDDLQKFYDTHQRYIVHGKENIVDIKREEIRLEE